MPSFPRILFAIVVCATQAACSTAPTRPDLARLYRIGTEAADSTPVIVVPGVFGSKLRDRTTRVEVWPGPWNTILFDEYRNLVLDFDRTTLQVRPDSLEAFDIADQALGQDFYGQIIDTLQRFGGYSMCWVRRVRQRAQVSDAITFFPTTGGRITSRRHADWSG
jgi:hypothetical protein